MPLPPSASALRRSEIAFPGAGCGGRAVYLPLVSCRIGTGFRVVASSVAVHSANEVMFLWCDAVGLIHVKRAEPLTGSFAVSSADA
jgi:hypothetical protein